MFNTERQSVLARLMAKENISVRHGNYKTAFFDVENRVLGLPIWKDRGQDVYDLLVGHEVGHALFTPAEGWHDSDKEIPGVPRAYVNVVEDIRIERKIQENYPGLVASFKRGYKELDECDFFGIKNANMSKLGLMDRINLKAKLRDLIEVEFTAEEQPLVDMAFAVDTWEDVLNACRELYNYVKDKQENEDTNQQQFAQAQNDEGETMDLDSDSNASGQDADDEYEDDVQSSNGSGNGSGDEEDRSDSEDSNSEVSDVKQDDKSSDDGEKKTTVTNSKIPGETSTAPEEIVTDSNFRNNEDQLLEDGDKYGNQPVAAYGLTSDQIKKIINPIDKIFKHRDDHMAKIREQLAYYGKPEFVDEKLTEYGDALIEFNNEAKKFVNVMAKEFEMRKAAYQYQRSSTARSGSLDVNKLHNYKFSDDIFLRVTHLPNAKSHGMVMFVDFSGSMNDVLKDVIKQTLILSSFCKKVNIPFDVYTFTTGHHDEENFYKTSTGQIDANCTSINHVLSSNFDKTKYERAYKDMFILAMDSGASYYDRVFMSDIELLGGTPLNETIIAADLLLDEFKAKHGVQNVNAIFLTDGAGQGLSIDTRGYDGNYTTRNIKLHLRKGVVQSTAQSQLTKQLLNYLRKRYTVIGYYLAARQYEFRGAVWDASTSFVTDEQMRKYRQEYNKQKFVSFDNACGYDRFFVIKGEGKSLNTDADEFEVKENAGKGEITRAFKKHAASKKTNRVFATQFAEMVA